ncbi:hypothetical protein FOL47_001946 [Perkinsus chesapeaki]|uniref:subtilisin n=1 Tax=Perkinsus chesapeaki TaxID=330153 RepID=A0A7J6N1R8_PERCH|nr:hypothetical protein FOL47_001946 [Perkinsus chesapeaki]
MWQKLHKLSLSITASVAIRSANESLSYAGGVPPVNDPLYSKQASYMEAINVPSAWRRLTSTRVERHRVTVGLVDSGVEKDHPDLVGNLVEGYNVVMRNSSTDDQTGHGTSMAGVLGAKINNSVGSAGVMDFVNIMPISVGIHFREKTESLAVDYAIRNTEGKDIKILIMAFSGEKDKPLFVEKLREADKAGILMIVTAGNTGSNTTINKRFPCALTTELNGMLCVAATEQVKMRLSELSSFANYVDIAAPGVGIVTTVRDKTYSEGEGTSSAASIIAGVAAMLYSIAPGLSSRDVKNILKDTAKKGLKDATGKVTLPFGLVDADAAVAKAISYHLRY